MCSKAYCAAVISVVWSTWDLQVRKRPIRATPWLRLRRDCCCAVAQWDVLPSTECDWPEDVMSRGDGSV